MNKEELIENFSYFTTWEEKYQYLIEMGERLDPMSQKDKNSETKVEGCTANVWISFEKKEGKFYFSADSDAHIVKGLEAVLINLLNGKTTDEIKNLDIQKIFTEIGLDEHLSPTRRNGFFSMINRINKIVGENG